MSDRDALLAGVIAAPADDLPRLVYADYLEEHGRTDADRARAEFIRAQIAAYRDPRPVADTNSRAALRAKELLGRHRGAWLPGLAADRREWVRFERGFPDTLTVWHAATAQAFYGGDLPADLLSATRLDLDGGISDPPLAPAHLAAPEIGRVRRLRFGTYRHGWQVLAAPVWGGLEELDLAGVPERQPMVSRTRGFPHLRRLRVGISNHSEWSQLGSGEFPAVADLTVQTARGASPRPMPSAPLCDSQLFSGLARLAWQGVSLTSAAAVALADGTACPGLVELSVSPNQADAYDDTHAAHGDFAAALDRPGLRHLVFGVTDMFSVVGDRDRFATTLAAGLPGLVTLTLTNCPLTAATVIALIESPRLPYLKRLSVTLRDGADRLRDYLMAADAPLRLDKLFVGGAGFPRAVRERLEPRLEGTMDTPETLDRLRRTRPDF